MIACRIPLNEISAAMATNVMDILTVIPEEEILGKGAIIFFKLLTYFTGIAYVQYKLGEVSNTSAWRTFWNYFRATWVDKYTPAVWNIHKMEEIALANRTNNPLERYDYLRSLFTKSLRLLFIFFYFVRFCLLLCLYWYLLILVITARSMNNFRALIMASCNSST
jgi:hypothetical protein